jgi:hypothetical protein
MEAHLWRFGQQYLGIPLVLWLLLNVEIIAGDCVDILGNLVHPLVQMFPDNNAGFQDDSSPIHAARSVHSWFEEREDALQHLLWPAQSPDWNIIEPLRSIVESRARSWLFPPSSLQQLEDVFQDEWYSIPLETIQTFMLFVLCIVMYLYDINQQKFTVSALW